MRTYLVVIDESEEARLALRFASRRAAKTGGAVHILALIEKADFVAWGGVQATMEAENREKAEELVATAAGTIFDELGLQPQITIRDGAAVQGNFDDYPVLRMADMPEIHTRLVKSNAAPTGMGEAGVGPVAPAIANAVAQLTGRRPRELPMSPARVKKVLA